MNEVLVWTVALVLAVFGIILLAVAGMAAIVLHLKRYGQSEASAREDGAGMNLRDRDQRTQAIEKPPSETRDDAQSADTGVWAWTKAWAFASIHALLVSLILGAVTFFEDLARANDEIQRTGTVKFPKQLLPGTISGASSSHRLSRGKSDCTRYEVADDRFTDLDETGFPLPEGTEWRVVSLSDVEVDDDDQPLR
ncbi:MAG: hypothetical protein GX620_01350 [Chloroflexi bacterium]|nr:hypothetical protein [Chloroflexota bacterium]